VLQLTVKLVILCLGVIDDAYIVPVSISYDKLVDGNFCDEQMVRGFVSARIFRAAEFDGRKISGAFPGCSRFFFQI